MNKVQQELANFKRILMINAFIKFNLIPPVDSEAWNANKSQYEMMPLHLLPVSHLEEANEQRIMLLLGKASAATTPDAKMYLFKELAKVTELVAGVQEWCHFYNSIPQYYLWDTHHL